MTVCKAVELNDNQCRLQVPGITLTKEQEAILATCRAPLDVQRAGQNKGHLVRVTAAAGTGKTTTLLSLALRAVQLGHEQITYLTFTNASAQDGTRRIRQVLEQHTATLPLRGVVVDARTLHSCALRALNKHEQKHANPSNKVWSDKQVKQWISHTLDAEIETFLEPCYRELNQRSSKHSRRTGAAVTGSRRQARDRVEFFLFKTLKQFCTKAMSRQDMQNKSTFGRDYFPALQFHKDWDKRASKLGFVPHMYSRQVHWYADKACDLWDRIVQEDIRCFDFIMKRAQLMHLEIPGSILLVDESQDMDGCQVHWVAEQQVHFGKHVFVVGDAAQTIYGFRGAKSEYLMDLSIDEELMLTESWRFGPGIADVANLVLFAKEQSDQTTRVYDRRLGCEKWKNWTPYRVLAGNAETVSHVTDDSLLKNWRKYRERSEKITLIARQNKTLFSEALTLIGFAPSSDEASTATHDSSRELKAEDVMDSYHYDENWDVIDEGSVDNNQGAQYSKPTHEPQDVLCDFPKMHINGYGENSGRRTWLSMFKLIGEIYKLYKVSQDNQSDPDVAAAKLPATQFPEFAHREVTWKIFCDDVMDREMNKYTVPIGVVNMYKLHTMAAVDLFKKEVIDRSYSVEEADVILTTCHAAKGMEWCHVEVANDFIVLANYACDSNGQQQNRNFTFGVKKQKAARRWKFGFPGWGDDLNLAYVACTRAKRTLSLPRCVMDCLEDFDKMLECIHSNMDDVDQLPTIKGLEQASSSVEIFREICDSLVLAFRRELQVGDGCSLKGHLVQSSCGPQGA